MTRCLTCRKPRSELTPAGGGVQDELICGRCASVLSLTGRDARILARMISYIDGTETAWSSPRETGDSIGFPPVTPAVHPDKLRPFAGQYVAIRGTEVIASSTELAVVIIMLRELGMRAHSVFRVPVLQEGW